MFSYVIILAAALLAVLLRKLTPAAGAAGAAVAVFMYLGLGYCGLALLGAFFLLGTAATSYKGAWKQELGLREAAGGRRVAQVLANGGAAATAALGAAVAGRYHRPGWVIDPSRVHLLQVMAASALSAATADTLASELGNVFGRNYFDLRSLRRGTRGADGVVSLEGTVAGFTGSCVIAAIYYCGLHQSIRAALVIVAAGTFGNLLDSWLGATLQRSGRLSNDGVNFFNTLAAALFAALLLLL
ncbi:DUF92 domain-containing protein [Flaviaesturariibacter flavus]|uniref:DUF92 domain-containing protein n=1 Tax=Flaviaesturariibacter flavus TaxID=2502780 RepID=A0A4R1BPK7_9BACT|nr:DUF92 domain-containing protein [Flaviaesturariibacter flavus]TCJ19623.1 DUF92 domain-containing protein [Flaviaesturariibacter flavus]